MICLRSNKILPLSEMELSSTKVACDEESATECLHCLWPFLWWSRLLGLCPLSRHGSYLVANWRIYTLCWLPTLLALVLQSTQTIRSLRQVMNVAVGDTGTLIDLSNGLIYYLHMLGTSCFMAWTTKEIPQLLLAFKRVESIIKKYYNAKDGLVRDCNLLFCFFAMTQLFGNVLYYYTQAVTANVTTASEFFDNFSDENIEKLGWHHNGVLLALVGWYCTLSWNFGDTVIGMFSLILSRYFTRMNHALQGNGSKFTRSYIDELRRDHQELCALVQHCNRIFSPLILLVYTGNVGFLFTRLYVALEMDFNSNGWVKLESVYAFFQQIILKIFLPSLLAANLHEKAHEGLNLIHNWETTLDEKPNKYRLLVIGRFVSQFEIGQIGLTGCGYFVINKSFIVTLISALVTYEVIILQFQATAK